MSLWRKTQWEKLLEDKNIIYAYTKLNKMHVMKKKDNTLVGVKKLGSSH